MFVFSIIQAACIQQGISCPFGSRRSSSQRDSNRLRYSFPEMIEPGPLPPKETAHAFRMLTPNA